MSKPVLYGADYSVYVRIARMALVEKGVDHERVAVDIFAEDGPPDWYARLNPFRRIPALAHGGLTLHETAAITRYVDEAFDGPVLQPADARTRAVMNQAIGLLDAYAYRAMVWDVYVERVSRPRGGTEPDEARIAAALPVARTCLEALDRMIGVERFLFGDRPTLADLHAAPMLAYFTRAPEGAAMLGAFPRLSAWWSILRARPSFAATEPTA